MFEGLKKSVENLQASDENRKKRWLFVLSGLAMIIVIGLWLLYMKNNIIPASETPTAINSPSFWQTFKTGLATIINQVENLIKTNRVININYSQ